MRMNKKVINEGDFSVLRNPSPYRVGRAPGFVRNADDALRRSYLMRRAEEENSYYQSQQLIGQLEQLGPMLQNVFEQMVNIHNFIEGQRMQPLITKKQKKSLDNINAMLNDITKTLSIDCINEIDKLGNTGD